jgi:hypothetical protein
MYQNETLFCDEMKREEKGTSGCKGNEMGRIGFRRLPIEYKKFLKLSVLYVTCVQKFFITK